LLKEISGENIEALKDGNIMFLMTVISQNMVNG